MRAFEGYRFPLGGNCDVCGDFKNGNYVETPVCQAALRFESTVDM
jgi:hypothetical protein